MPKKHKNFSRQRSSSKNLQRNVLLGIGAIVGIVAIVAIIASQSAPIDMSFPPREAGNPNARVVVEEFSDYQCPFCGLFATTAEIRLREEYIKPGRILFIYRSYPVVDSFVSGGSESHLAALAALCAGDQDMFWEYHDHLYQNQSGENQGYFNTARLQAFAAQLHLDSLQFNQCLSNQTHLNVVNADVQRGNALRINGTPTFFVNGVVVSGTSADFEWLFDAIDRELLKVGG
ncbi:MAG: thioredoxin domain-containing protein [Anaerolineales bacterium]|nr:thioredoxin domain-containing protein [Anaerolineales bacterium]